MRILSLVLAVCLLIGSMGTAVAHNDYDEGYTYIAGYDYTYSAGYHPLYEEFCTLDVWWPASLIPETSVDYLAKWHYRDLMNYF